MPTVNVPVTRFQDGDFPPVCALTGEPATTSRKLVVVARGAATMDPLARRKSMLARTMVGRITGTYPLSEAAYRRTAVTERARGVLAAVATVGFVVGVFTSVWLLLSATVLAILLGVSLYFTVGGELDKRGGTVTLLHVHPAFVAAVTSYQPDGGTRGQA